MKGCKLIHRELSAGLLGMSQEVHRERAGTGSKGRLSFLSIVKQSGVLPANDVSAAAFAAAFCGTKRTPAVAIPGRGDIHGGLPFLGGDRMAGIQGETAQDVPAVSTAGLSTRHGAEKRHVSQGGPSQEYTNRTVPSGKDTAAVAQSETPERCRNNHGIGPGAAEQKSGREEASRGGCNPHQKGLRDISAVPTERGGETGTSFPDGGGDKGGRESVSVTMQVMPEPGNRNISGKGTETFAGGHAAHHRAVPASPSVAVNTEGGEHADVRGNGQTGAVHTEVKTEGGRHRSALSGDGAGRRHEGEWKGPSKPTGPERNGGSTLSGKGGADRYSPAIMKDAAVGHALTWKKTAQPVVTILRDEVEGVREDTSKYPSPKHAGDHSGRESMSVSRLLSHKDGGHYRDLSLSHRVDGTTTAGEYRQVPVDAVRGAPFAHEGAQDPVVKPQALINRIVHGVNGPGRVRIVLSPPHLGTVDMDVLVRAHKVHVVLQAENNDVRQMLLSHMDSLRNSLHGQGLTVDSIDVSLQERSDRGYSESGRNEAWYRDSEDQKGKQSGEQGGGSSCHADSPVHEDDSPVRSDGLISLFV